MSLILTVWLTLTAWAGPAMGDGKPGAATPEALVAELVSFDTWGEFDQMLTCMAPGYREEVASMMVGIVIMGHAMKHLDPETQTVDPKAQAQMDKALAKHGLSNDMSEEAFDKAVAKANIRKLIEDLAALAFGEKIGVDATFPQAMKGVIEGMTIDGDRARALVDGEATHFVKIDGAWFLDRTPAPAAP